MRHQVVTTKFGRSTKHRQAMLAAVVCGLILEKRVRTTLPKARAARRLAERMVTLGKKGTLAARRRAAAALRRPAPVKQLFEEIAPKCAGRAGGYTRIIKMNDRRSDGSTMALLEWVDVAHVSRRKPGKSKEAAPGKDSKSA